VFLGRSAYEKKIVSGVKTLYTREHVVFRILNTDTKNFSYAVCFIYYKEWPFLNGRKKRKTKTTKKFRFLFFLRFTQHMGMKNENENAKSRSFIF
jgi:hypothetical protein